MSKVWRQAFGGMSCACSDDKCKVRQLFAMLGVEESAVRPDIGSGGGAIKRRVSRSARPENVNGIGDTTDQSPSSPRVQSPDGSRSVRGSHSRKASLVSIADAAPDSPSDRTSNSRDGLSVVTGRRVSYGHSSRKGSTDLASAHANDDFEDEDDDDDEGDEDEDEEGLVSSGEVDSLPSVNSNGSSTAPMGRQSSSHGSNGIGSVSGDALSRVQHQSRKRKPSAQHNGKSSGKDSYGLPGGPLNSHDNIKKARSHSGSP
ncbi:hypothetical protein LPJ73_006817, partial [Coemansia sp. RSA 2703]